MLIKFDTSNFRLYNILNLILVYKKLNIGHITFQQYVRNTIVVYTVYSTGRKKKITNLI